MNISCCKRFGTRPWDIFVAYPKTVWPKSKSKTDCYFPATQSSKVIKMDSNTLCSEHEQECVDSMLYLCTYRHLHHATNEDSSFPCDQLNSLYFLLAQRIHWRAIFSFSFPPFFAFHFPLLREGRWTKFLPCLSPLLCPRLPLLFQRYQTPLESANGILSCFN